MTTTIDRRFAARQDSGAMTSTTPPDPEVPERSASRRQFSAKYKARILAEYDAVDRSARGALLRREGLYSSLISTWRQQRDQGAHEALGRPAGRPKADPRDREIARLRARASRRPHAGTGCQRSAHFTSFTVMTSVIARAS
jgi:transposase-like protein